MFFSVIIPTFNREHILPKTIDSVLNQTYSHFELIIVDNGSTDNTKSLVESYMKKDQRIKYIWQINSGSPAGSRNTGIKEAKGEWVCFLDSDDYWYKDKLQKVSNYLVSNNKDSYIAITHWENNHNEQNELIKINKMEGFKKISLYEDLLFKGNHFSTSAMVIKKTILDELKGFDERKSYYTVEDYDLWLRLSKKGEVKVINETLGIFCSNKKSLSSNIELHNNNLKTLVRNHIEDYVQDQKIKNKMLKFHLSRIDYYKARQFQQDKKYHLARKIILHSIKMQPFSLKKWAVLFFSYFKISI